MDLQQLKREFVNPSSDYRLAPFWFLNHDLEDDELRWQINEMHEKGVDGFILHARHGLITPYMSDEWMDRIETCIEEADKLRMKAYLYDEDNWPSGPVGGQLIEQFPEYRMTGCALSMEFDVSGGEPLEASIEPEDGLIAVVAAPTQDGQLVGLPTSAVAVTSRVSNGKLAWDVPEGEWKVMVFTRRILRGNTFVGGYLDTLNMDAVAKFIEMTHEKYTSRFADYFGGTVPGIFTDEPAMNYHDHQVLPWTPSLPSEFAARHGYDLTSALPAVFRDAGPQSAQIRCDVHDTTTHLYEQAFFKQIYDYCDSVRLKSIGHVMNEAELYEMSRRQGDFFRGARYMHYGGVDFLTSLTWPDLRDVHSLNNLVGPKLASSAAHIYGKPRVMSEAFGVAGGWGVDLRLLKRLTDWQVALGVNLFEPHAFYYSIQGHRKWECPPGEFYQSPFWPYYKSFADYAARLCNIFAGADHIADVAVVLPVRALWAARGPGFNNDTRRVVDVFIRLTAALLRAGYDFEIIPEEELIENMDSLDLEHFVSGESYKALIFPAPDVMLDETVSFLNECVEDSVPVIFANNAPEQIVVRCSKDWNCGADAAGSLPPMAATSVDALAEAGPLALDSPRNGEEDALVLLLEGVEGADLEKLTKAVSKLLNDALSADVIVRPRGEAQPYVGDIIHAHYGKGEIDFYLFVNTSETESYSTRIELDTFGIPSLWSPLTGRIERFEDYESIGDRLAVNLDFAPTQSYLVGVTAEDISESAAPARPRAPRETATLSDEWTFRALSGNALPISEWKCSFEAEPGVFVPSAGARYAAEFRCEAKPSRLIMLVDGLVIENIWRRSTPLPVRISLNQRDITAFERGSYLDHLILEADVSEAVKDGKNVIEIHCPTALSGTGALRNPVILMGDFGIREDGGWVIGATPQSIRTGSWAEQGFPFYSGIGEYGQTVELPPDFRKATLRMDKPADMAEIVVNGVPVTALLWEPWEADITRFVKPGRNEITVRVANSLENLLLRRTKPSGILGSVRIDLE
ncbi:MAG: glycosyl hydrolase [Armatimonadota bacterium]|nr:glycosyl hydrolase [Armatimonadota bacterium]